MGSGIVESSTPASDSDGVIDSDSDVESDARHNQGKNTAVNVHKVEMPVPDVLETTETTGLGRN